VAKILGRIALGLVVLYAGAVLAFALLHYGGDRPGAGTVLSDFHAWLGVGSAEPRPPPPLVLPPPPQPEPPPPVPVLPPVEPEPAAPAGQAPSKAELDAVEKNLEEAETEARAIRGMDRGPAFDERVRAVLARLGEAREVLNRVLDAAPRDARGNKLWDRLQKVHNAVRHM
jgi:hypothetical protein